MFVLVINFSKTYLYNYPNHSLDQAFDGFLEYHSPQWKTAMITPGYEFNMVHLRNIEGPLENNLSELDLKNAGEIKTINKKNGKTGTFTPSHWISSMLSQKGFDIPVSSQN